MDRAVVVAHGIVRIPVREEPAESAGKEAVTGHRNAVPGIPGDQIASPRRRSADGVGARVDDGNTAAGIPHRIRTRAVGSDFILRGIRGVNKGKRIKRNCVVYFLLLGDFAVRTF